MPIYGFECDACGHQFDRLQKMSDPDPTECPECGAPTVKRQLTAPSFRLSGSGWYETDFKKDGDKKRNLTEKGDAPKSDTTSDAAPAAKAADSAPAAKPAESKATDSKPAQSKPADSKPAS
jgi:putative FmdB family regulatory protein